MLRRSNLLFPLLAFAVLAVLWVLNCSGPRPEVTSARLEPPQLPGQAYRAVVVVQNHGLGTGTVEVTLTLRNQATGEVFRERRVVRLEKQEPVSIAAEIAAPAGEYELTAEAEYPPR